jgi:GMP synthase-like glutamine amidotransferase
MRALALEHLHSNSVGVYGDVLLDRGIAVNRVRLDLGEPLPDWRDYNLLVVMGGGMSAYEEDQYPWLTAEKRTIREAVAAGCPYFGVCLGSQLLASALGARVFRGPEPELGVNPVFLCDAARSDPVFRGFPQDLEVFEWHSDTFDLPDGAVRLARSSRYENQAIRIGQTAYAIQLGAEPWLAQALSELKACSAVPPKLMTDQFGGLGERKLQLALALARGESPEEADDHLLLTVPTAKRLWGNLLQGR